MDVITLALAKKYVRDTADGLGAVKGKNATIQSITKVDGGNEVVFAWTLDDGTSQTETMLVPDGEKGEKGENGKDAQLNIIDVVLPVSAWKDNRMTVLIPGVSTDEVSQLVVPIPALESQKEYVASKIIASVEAENSIIFSAETLPTNDLTLYIAIFETNQTA